MSVLLPDADPQNPLCGACGLETEWYDDDPICEGCLLSFNASTMKADYLDPDARQCGARCDTGACQLSEGHTSAHYTPRHAPRQLQESP